MTITETNSALPGTGQTTFGGEESAATGNQALGRDDFLNLLVTQLKNQDPMDPMESAEFSAQLAQFSSLEQLTNLNDGMQLLIDQQTSAGNTQAVSYIGKHVKALGNTTQLTDGVSDGCLFDLGGATTNAMLYINDPNGFPVRTIELGMMESGEHTVSWDGKTDSGAEAGDGVYTFEVVAMNPEGNKVPVTTYISREITGVIMGAGTASLMAGALAIPLTDVVEVRKPPDVDEQPATQATSGDTHEKLLGNTETAGRRDTGDVPVETPSADAGSTETASTGAASSKNVPTG